MLAMLVAGTCGIMALGVIMGALYLDQRRRRYMEWQEAYRKDIESVERWNQACVGIGRAADEYQRSMVAFAEACTRILQEPFDAMTKLLARMDDAVRQPDETELGWWHRHMEDVKSKPR